MRQSQRQYSVEDYFFVDVGSLIRYEYFDGEILALSGGTRTRARISGNVVAFLDAALDGTDCEPYHSDMRVKTPSGLYTYPDVSVVCGEAEEIGEGDETTLLNPVLLEYLLIEQMRPSVELRRRIADNRWTTATVEALDQSVHLASINVDLPLARVYKRVKFAR
jgi:Uma2 family endonuclease